MDVYSNCTLRYPRVWYVSLLSLSDTSVSAVTVEMQRENMAAPLHLNKDIKRRNVGDGGTCERCVKLGESPTSDITAERRWKV